MTDDTVPGRKYPNEADCEDSQNNSMEIDFNGDADAATANPCRKTSFKELRVADSLRVDSNADMAGEIEQARRSKKLNRSPYIDFYDLL